MSQLFTIENNDVQTAYQLTSKPFGGEPPLIENKPVKVVKLGLD